MLAARPHRWRFALAMFAVGLAAYLPFASAGAGLLRGAASYARYWHGNGSVFPVAERALTPLLRDPAPAARVVCALALAAWLLLLLARLRGRANPSAALDACFLALAALFLLSPVVYPWYLCWTIPFLCLKPRPAWLLLTGSVFLFYAHAYGRPFVGIWWVSAIEYGVPLLLAGTLALARPGRQMRRLAGTAAAGLLGFLTMT